MGFSSFILTQKFSNDIPFTATELPHVFTTYRKALEDLRDRPKDVLAAPKSLPPLPDKSTIPAQCNPFKIPTFYAGLELALLSPLQMDVIIPTKPNPISSAHPFHGGSRTGHERIAHLISSGAMTKYKDTRNGLLGTDFSTKLSAWLALGCITARQIHKQLQLFEDGENEIWEDVEGYGKGENPGTKAIRFELLWRDYMRLCTRKIGPKLFCVSGIKEGAQLSWRSPTDSPETKRLLERFLNGTTGMGLIDASQREVFLTGYTSNRARQNVASFLSKHLGIDWRYGAEWYESMLVDYDLSNNWGNWQYTAGVGSDPRSDRIFNPVKQAYDYDREAEYIKTWVPELKGVDNPAECWQAWTIPVYKRKDLGLEGLDWVEKPLKKIQFNAGRRPTSSKQKPAQGQRRQSGSGSSGGNGINSSVGGNLKNEEIAQTNQTAAPGTGAGRGQRYAGASYGSGGGGGFNGRGYGHGRVGGRGGRTRG